MPCRSDACCLLPDKSADLAIRDYCTQQQFETTVHNTGNCTRHDSSKTRASEEHKSLYLSFRKCVSPVWRACLPSQSYQPSLPDGKKRIAKERNDSSGHGPHVLDNI